MLNSGITAYRGLDSPYIYVEFQIDPTITTTERKIITLPTALSATGGLATLFFIVLTIVLRSFQESLFN